MIAWLLIPAGVLMIVYTKKIVDFTGAIAFAEKVFGVGGTYPFIKIAGIVLIFVAYSWIFGGMQPFLHRTLGAFFGG